MMIASMVLAAAVSTGDAQVRAQVQDAGLMATQTNLSVTRSCSIGARGTGNKVLNNVAYAPCATMKHSHVNGQAWESAASDHCENPGRAAYGAGHHDKYALVHVRVGQQLITISPWQRVEGHGIYARLENARNRWLEDHGYVGGVRTFTNNDADMDSHEHAMLEDKDNAGGAPLDPRRIQPRATIRVPDDMPRFKSRMDVRGPALGGYRVLPRFANTIATSANACAPGVATFRNHSAVPGEVILVVGKDGAAVGGAPAQAPTVVASAD